MTPPNLFDRHARRLRRDRALRIGGLPFIHERAFLELLDRLGDVRRDFDRALLIGCLEADWRKRLEARVREVLVVEPSPAAARACGGIVADEDRLPFADDSFDLIICVGTLDSVDDLPGALLLARRILRPKGLFLAAMSGAGGLLRLRTAMLAADALGGGAAPRMHPAIDVRTAGDLLARAGLEIPVADVEAIDVSYETLAALVADLRAHGATNCLARRSRVPLTRAAFTAASKEFSRLGTAGRTTEQIQTLYLSGWAPPEP